MGIVTHVVTVGAVWTVSMGYLKRNGIISVHTSKVSNEQARKALELVLWAGEELVVRAEKLLKQR